MQNNILMKRLTSGLKTVIVTSVLCISSLQSVGASEIAPIKANDYRAAARLELATAYYSQRQYGAALQEVKQALALYPQYLQAYNMMGLVETALGNNKEAETAFQTALSMDPRDGDTHNNYGLFLCQNNRYTVAFTHFEAAAANPMYSTPEKAYFNAGRCARLMKDDTRAQQYYTSALKIDPSATAVMLEVADLQYHLKKYDAVLDVIDRIEAIQGQSAATIWLALRTEYRLGNINEVQSYGLQLVKKFPDSAQAMLYRARSFD